MKMGVDIETYSSVDLTKSGVRPYTEALDFTILLIGYKVDDQPTRIIDLADNGDGDPTLLPPVPSDLPAGDLDEFLCLLTNPEVTKTAYNASFERTCLARYFARPMPPEEWRCTMVQAATLGLPGTLAQVGAALGLEKQKLTEGAELIRYFCKPTSAAFKATQRLSVSLYRQGNLCGRWPVNAQLFASMVFPLLIWLNNSHIAWPLYQP